MVISVNVNHTGNNQPRSRATFVIVTNGTTSAKSPPELRCSDRLLLHRCFITSAT